MERIRAIGYRRVSTEEQSREGLSMDAQTDKIRAYCSLHDMDLVCIEEDAGLSGKTISKRPGLKSCLEQLQQGTASALVTLKLDRLSRSTRDVLELSDLFEREEWSLHSICERLDTSTASGRFVLTILAALAQMEREQIGERTSLALQLKKRRGERLGTTPLGFETVETEAGRVLVPVEAEQETARRIAAMRHEGMTLRAIAATLNAEAVATKRGARWHNSTVRSVLLTVVPRVCGMPNCVE